MNATSSANTSARALNEAFERPEAADHFDLQNDEGCGDAAAFLVEAAPAAPLSSTSRAAPAADLAEEQLQAWLGRIVDHDERALLALYDASLTRVYGLVLRLVHRPALAEEVLEEIYFQVWRQASRFDPGRGRALSWLLGMARSRAIDALRHEARFRHEHLDETTAVDVWGAAAPPDDLLDAVRGHAELHSALMHLAAQPRQLVALASFRGLSHEEIASQTALPLGTVKSKIRRALCTLREMLGDGGLRPLAS